MTRQSRPEGRPYERLGTRLQDTPAGYPSSPSGTYVRTAGAPATIAAELFERVGADTAGRIADALFEHIERERLRALDRLRAVCGGPTRRQRGEENSEVVARAMAAPSPPTWAELRAARGDDR